MEQNWIWRIVLLDYYHHCLFSESGYWYRFYPAAVDNGIQFQVHNEGRYLKDMFVFFLIFRQVFKSTSESTNTEQESNFPLYPMEKNRSRGSYIMV